MAADYSLPQAARHNSENAERKVEGIWFAVYREES
jgi:hypothetical protein